MTLPQFLGGSCRRPAGGGLLRNNPDFNSRTGRSPLGNDGWRAGKTGRSSFPFLAENRRSAGRWGASEKNPRRSDQEGGLLVPPSSSTFRGGAVVGRPAARERPFSWWIPPVRGPVGELLRNEHECQEGGLLVPPAPRTRGLTTPAPIRGTESQKAVTPNTSFSGRNSPGRSRGRKTPTPNAPVRVRIGSVGKLLTSDALRASGQRPEGSFSPVDIAVAGSPSSNRDRTSGSDVGRRQT